MRLGHELMELFPRKLTNHSAHRLVNVTAAAMNWLESARAVLESSVHSVATLVINVYRISSQLRAALMSSVATLVCRLGLCWIVQAAYMIWHAGGLHLDLGCHHK